MFVDWCPLESLHVVLSDAIAGASVSDQVLADIRNASYLESFKSVLKPIHLFKVGFTNKQ